MKVGDTARRTRRATTRDIRLFTEMTGDRNPLHYDAGAAGASRFGGIIVQGGVTSGLLNAVVAEDLPGPGSVFLHVDWSFRAPVRPGDEITAEVEVLEVRDDRPISRLRTTITNQHGTVVLDGTALVYREALPAPAAAAAPSAGAYYRDDLALVHHLGFGFHADACAPGILRLLEPVRAHGGLVLELGCGSGLLTRHLVDAGHRVVATDASPAMLDLARHHAAGAEDVRLLTLPDDPLPEADAIVSVGHVLSYLPDAAALERALVAVARGLRPGGVLALDLCDVEWGERRRGAPPYARVEDDWAIFTTFSAPEPGAFVREITTFVRTADGAWRRDDERHDNVLVDTSAVPALLAAHGVEAEVRPSFGGEELPAGLVAVIGRRAG